MYKNLVTVAFALASISAFSQSLKPGKLYQEAGFFKTTYYVGEEKKDYYQVQLHLDKTNQEAATWWQKSRHSANASTYWSIGGLLSVVTAVSVSDSNTQLAAWGAAIVCESAALVCILNYGSRKQKAINAYNKAYGY